MVDTQHGSLKAELFQDWEANRESQKSRVIMVGFRLAQHAARRDDLPSIVRSVVVTGYKLATTWVLGVEIPVETTIGPDFRLIHPQGIVINGDTVIGARCIIRCSSTIGNIMAADGTSSPCPRIGDDVELGANVVVIGAVSLGDGARVGAGSVVIRDVPPGGVAVGNPARVLDR
ncbi:MAG: serine acetyltransferase [Actinomycetota bacterium]|nr:serine acetyltransferase [Actinomycetota bacterium]